MSKSFDLDPPSRRTSPWLLVAGVSWFACLAACDAETGDPDPLDEPALAYRAGGEAGGVCDPREQIGIRPGPSCPSSPKWTGAKLFDVGTPWLETVDNTPVIDDLGRYCRYTWTGAGVPSEAQIAALAAGAQLEGRSASCRAVTAQADVLTDALGPTLRDFFRAHTGRASAADLGLPGTGTADPRVTVLVVDTQPNDFLTPPTSRHGRHMGNIINDITCPDGTTSCRVELEFVIGLPRVGGGGTDFVHGGMVATHADLAAGIYEGIRRWELANASRPVATKLVVNLSVAWEHEIFGGNENQPLAPIRAIRTALELASCKGALIIGSVGNESDFCGMSGPMLPAGWETRAAPDASRCAELGVAIPPGQSGYRPLVHAVGGLDIDLGPMPHAREDANPRLMADSTHAAAGDPLYGGLTGTSVGTAATSAAAALVWGYRPNLSPAQVMHWVYTGGAPLPGQVADFSLDGTTPSPPHRVDACAALPAACNATSGGCPQMPLSCLNATPPDPDELSIAFAAASPPLGSEWWPWFDGSDDSSCVDSCGNPLEIMVQGENTASCGVFAVDPVEHLVNPTPDSIGCPTCGIEDGVISLSLHPDFDGEALDDVMVTLDDDLGNTRYYDLGVLSLSSSDYTKVTLDTSQLPPGQLRSGTVSLDFVARRTTTDPLIIY